MSLNDFIYLFLKEKIMLRTIATKIFGSRNDRVLRRLNKIVVKINKLEPEYEALSDEQLDDLEAFLKTLTDERYETLLKQQ